MSTFGYKHFKAQKFYAYLLRCLKCCYEGKYEQLNIDLNFFLLLKNELSLFFLRNEENTLATLKSAIHIYSKDVNNKEWKTIEEEELKLLNKLIGE